MSSKARAAGPFYLKAAAIVLATLAAGVVSVRNAAVGAMAARSPDRAQQIWAGHPDVVIPLAMVAIGKTAATGSDIGEDVFASLGRASIRAPLAPEPFVVAGIRNDLAGKGAEAERAFLAARQRDPRSLPARYFLALHYLRGNDMRGLREIASLTRFAPEGLAAITPYLAQFAKQPGARAPMGAMFKDEPYVRSAVLTTLAADPANAALVLDLGGVGRGADAPWLGSLVHSLIDAGDYRQARAVWAQASGIDLAMSSGLFDPDFRDGRALPPFNWALTSSSVGLAERRSGRLYVIYYGEQDGPLARQLVLLPPGNYRFAAPATGDLTGTGLGWVVRCANAKPDQHLGSALLRAGALQFAVPADCPAVWIELTGRSSDIGRRNEATVGPARLIRVAGR